MTGHELPTSPATCRWGNVDAPEAYVLCSLAADVRITQLVNEQKGCHVVLSKSALGG